MAEPKRATTGVTGRGSGTSDTSNPSDRGLLVVAGAVTLLALAAVASVWVPAPHTGGDNAGYLSLADALYDGVGYSEQWDPVSPPHTKYPPVFPLLLAGLIALGATGWAAFKTLVAGLLAGAVVLVFAWASGRRGPIWAGAIATLTILSSGWLDASRWILSDPPFLALTFLTLWAVERVEGDDDRRSTRADTMWMALAGASAILALFTRSAGIPLVIALVASLALRAWVRALAAFSVVLVPLVTWWVVRARTGGQGAYQSEFWMVNPYEPELGTIGMLDIPARIWANVSIYVGDVLPREWWGPSASGVVLGLGVVLALLAVWGWLQRIRRGPRTAELFVAMYAGLILVWPAVWSGSRFLLPLHPFLLFYAAEAIAGGLRSRAALARAALAAGFLVLALPSIPGWTTMAVQAAGCRRLAEAGDVFRCHGPAFQEFRSAAAWSGLNLPPDAVVLNRKPRIHHLLGGPPGRVFPFTTDPDLLLAEADRIGARYLLMDYLDSISPTYLTAVISGRPSAFCHIAGWGGEAGPPATDLFGILSPEERALDQEPVGIQACPESYYSAPPVRPELEGRRIPRLLE